MNATRKVTLVIAGVYLIVCLVLALVMFLQAKQDVEVETQAAVEMAETLIDLDLPRDQVAKVLAHSRHLRSVDLNLTNGANTSSSILAETATDIARWDYQRMYLDPSDPNLQLLIYPDPSAENKEVLVTVMQVFGILLLSFLLTLITLQFAVKSRLRPLKSLCSALQSVGAGKYDVDVERSDINEINSLVNYYQDMATSLNSRSKQIQRLRARVANLQEEERQSLARELHDNLGQLIAGIRVQSFMLRQQSTNQQFVERTSQQIGQQCDEVQSSLRQMTQQLYPVSLGRVGLVTALRDLIERWSKIHQIPVTLIAPDHALHTTPEFNTHLYRIMQEALSNIIKHAGATEVRINLEISDRDLRLEIRDNGVGLDIAALSGNGIGMESMRDRARLLEGSFFTESSNGTRIVINAPIPEKSESDNVEYLTG